MRRKVPSRKERLRTTTSSCLLCKKTTSGFHTRARVKNDSLDRVWPSAVEQQPDGLPVRGSYSRNDVTGTCTVVRTMVLVLFLKTPTRFLVALSPVKGVLFIDSTLVSQNSFHILRDPKLSTNISLNNQCWFLLVNKFSKNYKIYITAILFVWLVGNGGKGNRHNAVAVVRILKEF